MKFWFVFPLAMLMLSPVWLDRLDRRESRMDRQGGAATADGSGGIPPHYADGSGGIPPH